MNTHRIVVEKDNRAYCSCTWVTQGSTGMDASLLGRAHLNRMRLKGDTVDLLIDVK